MPTRSQLLTQSSLSPTLNSRFDADWQAAQERYNAGINSGYNQQDADALYLQPVRSKWKIIASSPQLVHDEGQLNKFNNEFDESMSRFHRNINESGQDIGSAANYGGSVNPTLDKWSVLGSLPSAPQEDSSLIQDQMGALKEVQDGYNPIQVLWGHDVDRWSPQFQNRFYGESLRAGSEKQKIKAKEESQNSPAGLRAERFKLSNQMKQANDNGAAGIADAYQQELNRLDSQITNGAPQTNSEWQFAPPENVPQASTETSSEAQILTPKDKASLANQISQAHPDWTREQIILAVNGKLKGANP